MPPGGGCVPVGLVFLVERFSNTESILGSCDPATDNPPCREDEICSPLTEVVVLVDWPDSGLVNNDLSWRKYVVVFIK